MYPVDVVRALRMSSASSGSVSTAVLLKDFYRAHGLIGFVSQGVIAEMLRATFSRVVKFWLQPIAHKSFFDGKTPEQGTSISRGISGSLATFPEVWTIAPLENAKLALQLDREKRFKGTGDVLKFIYRERGFLGLYVGYTGMQLRQCLWTGGFFYSLNIFKGQSEKLCGGKFWYTDVLAGFGAGVFGTTLNCWTDVVRTSIQKKGLTEMIEKQPRPSYGPSYIVEGVTSVINETATIFKQRGISGLYLGYGFKAMHLGGSGALLALLMPRFEKWWLAN